MALQHTIRTPEGGEQVVTLTPSSAIRSFCTECMGFTGSPVDCTSTLCPLYPFRGKSLAYKGKRELGDDEREALIERAAQARLARG